VSMTSLREGQWKGNPPPALGHDPQGKVLGILGMGGIGRAVARRVGVFGMTVKYYNRTRLSEDVERECGAEYVSFERLMAESDVLSLYLPLNGSTPLPPTASPRLQLQSYHFQPSTRHTLSTPQFALMK